MKRWIVGIILLLLLLIAVTACGFSGNPLRIGYAGHVSQPFSEDASGFRGAALRMDELNAIEGAAGRTVELVLLDTPLDPERGLEGIRTLRQQGAVAIVAPLEGEAQQRIAAWAETEKQLLVNPSRWSEGRAGMDDWLFHIGAYGNAKMEELVSWLVAEELERAGIVWDDTGATHAEQLSAAFRNAAGRMGMQVVMESGWHPAGNTPFLRIMDDARNAGVQALLLLLSPESMQGLVEQASLDEGAETGTGEAIDSGKMRYFMTDWSYAPSLLATAEGALDGVGLVSGLDYASEELRDSAFKRAYREKYGLEPDAAAIHTYEAVGVLVEALRMAPDTKPETLKATLLGLESFKGLQTMMSFDRYGDIRRPIYRFLVSGEEVIPVSRDIARQ